MFLLLFPFRILRKGDRPYCVFSTLIISVNNLDYLTLFFRYDLSEYLERNRNIRLYKNGPICIMYHTSNLTQLFWTVCVKASAAEDDDSFSVYLFRFQSLRSLTPVDTVTVYSESYKTQNAKIAFSGSMWSRVFHIEVRESLVFAWWEGTTQDLNIANMALKKRFRQNIQENISINSTSFFNLLDLFLFWKKYVCSVNFAQVQSWETWFNLLACSFFLIPVGK